MGGTVEVRHGDLLRSVSDMAVLPCSTAGTVSMYVRRLIDTIGLQGPSTGMPLGSIEIRPLVEIDTLASFVAWASSVRDNRSSLQAVLEIARSLGKTTKSRPEIKSIAAPLLGTDAGGLVPRDVLETMTAGFSQTSVPEAKLTLFVLDEALYLTLYGRHNSTTRKKESYLVTSGQNYPRVFISYTGTNSGLEAKVERLAKGLQTRGCSIRFAPWHLRLGADLPQWMTNEIQLADRVLIVSDEAYAERANKRLGGVGWETMIIQGDMMTRPLESVKYLGVIISDDFNQGVPDYLKSKYLLHWPSLEDDQMREERLSSALSNSNEK